MNKDIQNLDLELSLILARVCKSLKLRNDFALNILEKKYLRNDMIFFPQLTLLAAQGPKGINKKVRTLAVLVQIMYLSTEIHNQVPDGIINKNNLFKDVQLPILLGDFLYSKFYDILCAEDCIDFLDDFIQYIKELNLGWINYLKNEISLEEICVMWHGKLASLAMELAACSSGLNNYLTNVVKEYGLGTGTMFGVMKLNPSSSEVEKSWSIANKALNLMPASDQREALYRQASYLYKKINNDLSFEKVKFSAVAEI